MSAYGAFWQQTGYFCCVATPPPKSLLMIMGRELSLFIGTFTTLLAIINPLEVLPVYLKLLEGKDVATHRQIAWKSCIYGVVYSEFSSS